MANEQVLEPIDELGKHNKCMELLDKKKATDERISKQICVVTSLGKQLDEGMQQQQTGEVEEEGEQTVKEEEAEQMIVEKKKFLDFSAPGNSDMELNITTTAVQPQQSSESDQPPMGAAATRPRRSKRMYSPSPPPSLLGSEASRKKKKEKSESSLSVESASTSKSALKWAKVPPPPAASATPISSLSSSLDSNGFSAVKEKAANAPAVNKNVQQHQQPPPISDVPTNSDDQQLIRQNEKLTRENVQLKQKNQEQHQQIQALIGANRELIWAFNESRREHDELMQQLGAMAKLMKKTTTGSGGRTNKPGGPQQQQMEPKTFVPSFPTTTNNPKPKGARIGRKRAAAVGPAATPNIGGEQQHRPKKSQRSMMYVTENALPPSLEMLKKQQHNPQYQQQQHDEDAGGDRDQQAQQTSAAKQQKLQEEDSLSDILKEITEAKQQLMSLTPDPNLNMYIGSRKPAFYTPKEFGDWHSVVSSMLRRQIVYQLFESDCPNFARCNLSAELAKGHHGQIAEQVNRSLDDAFVTENALFASSASRDAYFGGVAATIVALRKATATKQQQQQTTKSSGEEAARKRTLADALKRKRSLMKPEEAKEKEKEETAGAIQQ